MRLIIVLGGIFSGVGKGIAAASIGRILQAYGFSVTAVKIDPYINFDAGTLRPTEHGEVWVTDDGGEIDQDLGNYERFLGISIPKQNNITTGQVYWRVIRDERKGRYLGQTVQFIPHVPNEIKRRIKQAAKDYDFVVVEIGGVVGDYENLPFLFAMKSFEVELGKNNVAYVLVTYLPIPNNLGEMKTKPTQQAIRLMNETGISPDFVICRAVRPLDDIRKHKIETYANIPTDHIISAPDAKTVYDVPINFEKDNLGIKLLRRFNLQPKALPDWSGWTRALNRIKNPSRNVRIAMVGKYVASGDFALPDSYISVNQALEHAGAELDIGPCITWIDSAKLENLSDHDVHAKLREFDGILIPGGFGSSGVEGKLAAIRYARKNNVPFLGLCFGFQLAVVEFARDVCKMSDAHSTEINPATPYPVIDVLPNQRALLQKSRYGASMRLGAYAAVLQPGSQVHKAYRDSGRLAKDLEIIKSMALSPGQSFRLGTAANQLNLASSPLEAVVERHRHRYEVNPKFVPQLSSAGILFSGWHVREDGTQLMEFLELPNHRCFLATQAHPEFKSRLSDPAPLFLAFVKACAER
ncbi:MAG: CTP synthase [Candidatus Aenigmatarchaeota archaeon]